MSEKQATPKRVRVEGVPNLYRRPADGRYEAGYTGTDGKWHIKTLRRAHPDRGEGRTPAGAGQARPASGRDAFTSHPE